VVVLLWLNFVVVVVVVVVVNSETIGTIVIEVPGQIILPIVQAETIGTHYHARG
jgi:hypothetical protein